MRWDDLFDDLEGQFASAQGAEFHADVEELALAEQASVALATRLKAAGSSEIALRLRGGTVLRGVPADATATWVRLREGPRDHLVPLLAVVGVSGLPGRSLPLTEVEKRLSLGHALRILLEGKVRVVVEAADIEYSGVVVSVGFDHLDLADSSRDSVAIPFSALTRVTSA